MYTWSFVVNKHILQQIITFLSNFDMASWIPDIIIKKRKGERLNEDEIKTFVDSVTNASMQEHQIGAMLMAIYLKGMTADESRCLTQCMMKSGEVLKWPEEWKGIVVDKHSTGGVGDKISLTLAPALAACGLKVPMISGRGLELTGGTLDKLESIPGYDVNQSAQSIRHILDRVGCCIVGQTEHLVPADRKLYAVRDVTGTVDSIPLITASIMSKKCAEGLDALVLDVKTGCGAVMRDKEDALELAKFMCEVGNKAGIKTTSLLTNMDRPTGFKIGNALEIVETLQCLAGKGPASTMELVEVEGGYLLYNVGKVSTPEEGRGIIAKCLEDGSAMKKFCQLLKAQGVSENDANKLCQIDSDVFSVLPKAKLQTEVPALDTGYVCGLDAEKCAQVNFWLGAGRIKTGESIDHAVGLDLHVELGECVTKGESWVTVHHNRELPEKYINVLQNALFVAKEPLQNINKSPILDIIHEE